MHALLQQGRARVAPGGGASVFQEGGSLPPPRSNPRPPQRKLRGMSVCAGAALLVIFVSLVFFLLSPRAARPCAVRGSAPTQERWRGGGVRPLFS